MRPLCLQIKIGGEDCGAVAIVKQNLISDSRTQISYTFELASLPFPCDHTLAVRLDEQGQYPTPCPMILLLFRPHYGFVTVMLAAM
jgi:hypothetical protein